MGDTSSGAAGGVSEPLVTPGTGPWRIMQERVRVAVRADQPIGFDTEWDAPTIEHRGKHRPDALRASLVGYSLAVGARGWYVPATAESLTWLAALLGSTRPVVYAHSWKSELHALRAAGITPRCTMRDSELLCWLAGMRLPGKAGLKLKALAERYLGVKGPDFMALAAGRAASAIPPAELAPYAAKDAVLALRLGLFALERCRDLRLDEQIALDHALIPVSAEMEATGVTLDTAGLTDAAARCESGMVDVEAAFHDLTRTTVAWPTKVREPKPCPAHSDDCTVAGCVGGVLHFKNGKPKMHVVTRDVPTLRGAMPGNDRQVGRWMFDELRWWPRAGHPRTENGWSVAEEDIRRFTQLEGPAGEAARLRLRYQALRKYASTYTRALAHLAAQSGDGRLHAGFKQDGTKSQRYSSSGPNLQNLPASERAPLPWLADLPDIRASFIAPPGRVFVIRDWSQLELRLVAHYSRDPALLAAYRDGLDLHAMTVEALGGIPRRSAKIVNFSVIYRITAPTLARKVSMATNDWSTTPDDAQRWIDAFYERYPGVRRMQEDFIEAAQRTGYAETLGGFKAPIGPWGPTRRDHAYACNQACNLPIQGSAGAIAKAAMRELTQLREARMTLPFRWVGQVHDELIVECDEADAVAVNAIMEVVMSNVGEAYGLLVPLDSSGGVGRTWAEAKG